MALVPAGACRWSSAGWRFHNLGRLLVKEIVVRLHLRLPLQQSLVAVARSQLLLRLLHPLGRLVLLAEHVQVVADVVGFGRLGAHSALRLLLLLEPILVVCVHPRTTVVPLVRSLAKQV